MLNGAERERERERKREKKKKREEERAKIDLYFVHRYKNNDLK